MKSKGCLLTIALLFALNLSLEADPKVKEVQGVLNHEIPLKKGETTVWSPLFQASWDKLNASHAGKLDKVVPPNPLMAQLDKFEWDEKSVMPKGGYTIFAGPSTVEFAQQTAKAIKKQFGVTMTPDQLPKDPAGNAVYGFLIRELAFKKQFFRSRTKPLRFKTGTGKIHNISFFGTAGELSDNYGTAVKVLDYADAGKRFVLSISTDKEGERLIIYRPEKAESENFANAFKHVRGAIKKPLEGRYGHVTDGHLHKNDIVKIPYINLESKSEFTNRLGGKRYYKGDPQPWYITAAYQQVNFELFEKGAKVRIETSVADGPFGNLPEGTKASVYFAPRNFICEQPFFIFIWRDAAVLPYFAARLDGEAVFKPMNSAKQK